MLDAPITEALSRYLDLQTSRMKLTATNMANVETPGYRTQGIDTDGEFARALGAHGFVDAPTVQETQGLIARPDGNNVSMDRESMQMAETQLQFRTGVELLRHQFTMLSDAIRSDAK
ncbi:flagellar basal body rod protein FlgB [Terriglobus sp.]|uniref:flagellar basal body rod protein FlgB n=1 Tax=Terriglobus sp. TaxID=1889013 RepID=UPI003B003595